ncbi:MAG: beta-galactosidase [Nitrospiraceae bacterium]|nr:beta-galactosidase [Nitrospiraceae bacterium]
MMSFTTKTAYVVITMIVFIAQSLPVPAATGASSIDNQQNPVPIQYFGLHMQNAREEWPKVRFGSWRLWDANVSWRDLEPQPGQWRFEKLDQYVALAQQNHVELVLPLGVTPAWAAKRPLEPSAYGPGNASEPKNFSDWEEYVEAVARRYRKKIKYYEFWNGVNLKKYYTGNIATLVDLQKRTYAILKENDPGCVLVSASVSTEHADYAGWLDRYLAAGGGEYADIIGIHFYSTNNPPEAIVERMHTVRTVLRRYGADKKPLWNTEMGWWIENTDGTPTPTWIDPKAWTKLDANTAAAYVARSLVLGRSTGLDRYFWYSWDHAGVGLVEPRARKIKDAGLAYGKVVNWLEGAEFLGCRNEQDLWICSLKKNSRRKWILWTTQSAARDWVIPKELNVVSIETLLGIAKTTDARKISVGSQPVLMSE